MDNPESLTPKAPATESEVIGGLRCGSCGKAYRPKINSHAELCCDCLLVLLQNERYPLGRLARERVRSAKGYR